MRHYLSWIEGLTTNQYVEGSNPPCRTRNFKGPGHVPGPFLFRYDSHYRGGGRDNLPATAAMSPCKAPQHIESPQQSAAHLVEARWAAATFLLFCRQTPPHARRHQTLVKLVDQRSQLEPLTLTQPGQNVICQQALLLDDLTAVSAALVSEMDLERP